MKLDLSLIVTLAISVGGIIYTYGKITERVDRLDDTTKALVKLSDDNMNSVLVLNTKMEVIERIAEQTLLQ